MNYNNIYQRLITKAKNRKKLDGYFEIHHIIPKSEGGSDDEINLVKLTAREHYFSHILLYKINPTPHRINAIFMMLVNGRKQKRYFPSSRKYEKLKLIRSQYMSTIQTGKKHIFNPITNERRFVDTDILECLLNNGWVLGFNVKTTKNKIGIHIPNTKIKKYINPDELSSYISNGWVKGLFPFKSSHSWKGTRSGSNNPTYGKRAIHNPITGDRKYVTPSEIDSFLKKGYKLGRGKNG